MGSFHKPVIDTRVGKGIASHSIKSKAFFEKRHRQKGIINFIETTNLIQGEAYNLEFKSSGEKLNQFVSLNRKKHNFSTDTFKAKNKDKLINHSMKSHSLGSAFNSAMEKGFVNKESSRIVQKMSQKDKDKHFEKGAVMTEESQSGNGENIHFQYLGGDSFAKDKYKPNKKV